MQRANSTQSDGKFWKTIELLAGKERRRSTHEYNDADIAKLAKHAGRNSRFNHPHVRARLEKLMGVNLVKLTDKVYVEELQNRITVVNEENLNKRIAARVLDEMERLKKLILCGKTPLEECPPELYNHPVFVFWRLVNDEVARACKARADAYFRKLKAFNRNSNVEQEGEDGGEEQEREIEHLTTQQLIALCQQEVQAKKIQDIENGHRFADADYDRLKYISDDIKHFKYIRSVEELYRWADVVIGVPRTL